MPKSSTTLKTSFDTITSDNKALTAEIRTYVAEQQTTEQPQAADDGTSDGDGTLRKLIRNLYGRMCDFVRYRGSAATPDKKIIAAWESFLETIRALASVKPYGHFIAARMVLYLANAFASSWQLSRRLPRSKSSVKAIELRCDFLIAMDDTLLACLTALWTQSRRREMYQWVFTDYPVQKRRMLDPSLVEGLPEELRIDVPKILTIEEWHEEELRERFEVASLTSPAQLPPMRPGRLWVRPEGDTTPYARHPEASKSGSKRDPESGGQELITWQYVGSDGPIRARYDYEVVDEDTGEAHWRGREMLRRSRQFVLDARRIAMRNHFFDTRAAARDMLVRTRRLPRELQNMIMAYVEAEEPREYPYLSKLDLSKVYRPFPARAGGNCDACLAAGNNKTTRSTCPRKAVTIWSLPLRTFHTLHKAPATSNKRETWHVCALENCTGHHRDESWRAVSGPGHSTSDSFLDAIVSSRCGESGTTTTTKLDDVHLEPLDPVELPTEAQDNERKARLFDHGGPGGEEALDRVGEALWSGLCGLKQVVRHKKVLLGRHPSGSTTTDPTWALGRTFHEEEWALGVLSAHMGGPGPQIW